jgi:hypothetical protein
MNVSGPGCTENGSQTGITCVVQNVKSGLTEQDYDIPRNIDIIADHFRTNIFDFGKALSCPCNMVRGA